MIAGLLLLASILPGAESSGTAATSSHGQWPQWGYDSGRGGVTPESLPPALVRQWVRDLPAPRPAWPESQPWLRYDVSYSPVIAEGRLVVGSMVDDTVTAYDLNTGEILWRFTTDGPVRLAPAIADGRVFVGSDDGHLYCLDLANGHRLWQLRGGPRARLVLGNQRLISTWPVRNGPVVHQGVVYFAAGLWPFMGIFVHAVDAASGRILWTNSGHGTDYLVQPHSSPAFSGFAPAGYFAVAGQTLVAAGGRTQPACYDLATGDLRHFDFGQKDSGAWHVSARGGWYFNGVEMRALADGKATAATAGTLVDKDTIYMVRTPTPLKKGEVPRQGVPQVVELVAQEMRPVETVVAPAGEKRPSTPGKSKTKAGTSAEVAKVASKGVSAGSKDTSGTSKQASSASKEASVASKEASVANEAASVASKGSDKKPLRKWVLPERWHAPLPPPGPWRLFLKAGNQFVLAHPGEVAIVIVQTGAPTQSATARIVWREQIDGEPWSIIAADGHLVVVTTSGKIECFGRGKQGLCKYASTMAASTKAGSDAALPASIRRFTEGYGLLAGLPDAEVVEHVIETTRVHWIGIDPDAAKIEALRRRLIERGLYGARAAIHQGDPARFPLPPYLVSIAWVQPSAAAGAERVALLKAVFSALRPYGGSALFSGEKADVLSRLAAEVEMPGAKVIAEADGAVLSRPDAPSGAGQWTHQYADAGNSVVSEDRLVKAPLGLLWFGGPSHDDVLPRHGHGPSPQVVAGRIFIEGPDMLRAVDLYTGRLLWQRELPGIGTFYDNTKHQPGANEIGSNYVSSPEAVYVADRQEILMLDPGDGRILRRIRLPRSHPDVPVFGGFLAWDNDQLVVATGEQRYRASSSHLVAFNRATGRQLWTRQAKYGFRHNAIVLGRGRLYAIDSLSPAIVALMKRRGEQPQAKPDYQPQLMALDLASGQEVWSAKDEIFGTFLSYSRREDILLEGGSNGRDRAKDEVAAGMAAYAGATGKILWADRHRLYYGPCLLHGDTIITQPKALAPVKAGAAQPPLGASGAAMAFSLLTGQPRLRPHPLSGEEVPWGFQRNYGCNTAIGCQNLITFRSAAAGFYDLVSDGGTGNLGGFKSGCTSNLIAAGGVLAAPDYTRTCTCRYQNQASLALVHDPEVEVWTFNEIPRATAPLVRLGVNLGAPGDRMADDGTLWLDWPSQGGRSPDVPIEVQPSSVRYFRTHSSRIQESEGQGLPWVAASGARGIGRIAINLSGGVDRSSSPRPYTVRLHFAEPDNLRPGDRVFAVSIQGRRDEKPIDLAAEAGVRMPLVREYSRVAIGEVLEITLTPMPGCRVPETILCGVQVVAGSPAAQ